MQPLNSSGSPEALQKIQSWLHTCAHEHLVCSDAESSIGSQAVALPHRLLDLVLDGTSDCRLITTDSFDDGFPNDNSHSSIPRYAALSHCWGAFQPLTTSKENMEQHLVRIKWEKLPKTFQDAVFVCRS